MIVVLLNIFLNDIMLNFIKINLIGQISLATTGTAYGSFIDIIFSSFIGYFNIILEYPFIFLFGDGFSNNSLGGLKGGDVGFIETMIRLGLPFFLIVSFGFINIFYNTLKEFFYNRKIQYSFINEILIFSACIILFILLLEVHYSAWNAKSILPILFICLGLLRNKKLLKIKYSIIK